MLRLCRGRKQIISNAATDAAPGATDAARARKAGTSRWIASMLHAAGCATLTCCAAAPGRGDAFDPRSLAARMQARPVVLLGEVHDNAMQHAVRAEALARVLQAGLRPALAFEQLDRGVQPEVDRVLAEAGPDAADRLAELIDKGWNRAFYKPLLELAVRYRLPVVAANLSRADAIRVSQQGFGAVFDAGQQRDLGLDPPPGALLQAQRRQIDEGHCHLMEEPTLTALARAQIARDAALAQAIGPYLQRGVMLMTGNGHARRDIGVPHFLPARQQDRVISIGLIERDTPADAWPPGAYDVVFRTPVQPRKDPCEALKEKARGDHTR